MPETAVWGVELMRGWVTGRTKRRTPCNFSIQGRRQNGFVLDISRTGLFIQTSADPAPGLRLDIDVVFNDEILPMHVEVARRKKVPPQLLTVAHGGIGVRILSAPEGYYRMLGETGVSGQSGAPTGSSSPASSESRAVTPAESAGGGFRVRVGQVQGTRTKTLRVSCETEDDARREVLEELGEDWKVLEVIPA